MAFSYKEVRELLKGMKLLQYITNVDADDIVHRLYNYRGDEYKALRQEVKANLLNYSNTVFNIKHLVEKLDEREQSILKLKYFDKNYYSWQEIANITNYSISRAKEIDREAVQKIHKLINENTLIKKQGA